MLSPYHYESQKAGIWIPTWECDTMRTTYEMPYEEETALTLETPEALKSNVTIQTTKKSAHIIIASLPTRATAERYISELNITANDTPTILEANEGTAFRVAIRSYASSKDAMAELEEIHSREGMSKAWILGK